VENEFDLYIIMAHAEHLRRQLLNNEKPDAWRIKRLSELAQNIEREYDEQYQKWCDEQELSCTE